MGTGLVVFSLESAPGARVAWNALYRGHDPDLLAEDAALVELPGGTLIDVSWHPEHDPRGAYRVTVIAGGDWDNPVESGSAPDADGAARLVSSFADRFARPPGVH